MRPLFTALLLFALFVHAIPVVSQAAPRVEARGWLVASADKIFWEHNKDAQLPPASLTKIMTVMLALQNIPPDKTITVSPRAAAESGSRTGFKAGDKVRAGLLAAAALMESGNDACMALAEETGGSAESFVKMMNDEARKMGLLRTNFKNPCGHDAPGHYSSASDMLAMARAAMSNPLFAAIVAQRTGSFSTVDGKRKFTIRNKNELIGRYPGAVGVKTGTTDNAGKCLVALVRRDGHEVWLVLLNSKERWWSSSKILDYALRELGAHLDF